MEHEAVAVDKFHEAQGRHDQSKRQAADARRQCLSDTDFKVTKLRICSKAQTETLAENARKINCTETLKPRNAATETSHFMGGFSHSDDLWKKNSVTGKQI